MHKFDTLISITYICTYVRTYIHILCYTDVHIFKAEFLEIALIQGDGMQVCPQTIQNQSSKMRPL